MAVLGGCATVALGQADDPLDSPKVLHLTSFASFETIPWLSGAIDLDHPKDGTGRVFVSTNEGQIHGFSSTGESLGVFLDVAAPDGAPDFDDSLRFSTNGLTYIAFHPDYAKPGAPGRGKLYTYYQSIVPGARAPDYSGAGLPTRPGDERGQFVIAEWETNAANPDRIDPATRREVLRLEFSGPAANGHSVCWIGFNPFAREGESDYGLLYIPTGDMNNGGGVPNWQHVQDIDNPFGKVLRINPLPSGGDAYSVPPDNPFADGGELLDEDGVTEEIAAWGFRNPQNASFARGEDGLARLVVFDIGADDYEEINIVASGFNHGWTRYDGPAEGNAETTLLLPSGARLSSPAAVYDHVIPNLPGAEPTAEATAITGGYVVSDPSDDGFQDQLLFGDLPRGAFFHADYASVLDAHESGGLARLSVMQVAIDGGEPGAFRDLVGWERGDVRFGVDESGRVFLVSRWVDTVFLTDLVADQLPICRADWNGDGSVDTLDFLAFLNDWSSRDLASDLNGDGRIDTLDFLLYLNLFAIGCG